MHKEQHRVRFDVDRRILVVQVYDCPKAFVRMNFRNTLGDLIAKGKDPIGEDATTVWPCATAIQGEALATCAEFPTVIGCDRKHVRLWVHIEVVDQK